jgi:hypothetical protein
MMARIPKLLHYTFGLGPDFGGKPWSLVHHVCLKSAVERIKPDEVFLYYEYQPTGPWWALSRPLLTPVQIEAPREIFGRPLVHVAHRADVVRLQKLLEHGGIYLDADVLVQRDFDDLLGNSTVMGQEGKDAEYGIANAVILAEPAAPFLRRWLEEYRTFRSVGRDEYWSEHSVLLPAKLATQHPDEITVLSHKAFFWPSWTDEHLHRIFRSTKPVEMQNTYANHLWEANAWRFLEHLTPQRVLRQHSNFSRWARPFLTDIPADYGTPSVAQRAGLASRQMRGAAIAIRTKVKGKLRGAKRRVRRFLLGEQGLRRRVFQDVYRHHLWGREDTSTFYSGVGSRGEGSRIYVEQMSELLRLHQLELDRPLTIVDLGCGDFEVGRALLDRLPNARYIGCDIVPELVRHNEQKFANERIAFRQVDIVADPLPPGDVCLVRQVLQHLSNAEIKRFLPRLTYQYVYVTEGHPAQHAGPVNPDKETGFDVRFDWRRGRGRGVELDQPPYGLETREMFRALTPPAEVVITERILSFHKENEATKKELVDKRE